MHIYIFIPPHEYFVGLILRFVTRFTLHQFLSIFVIPDDAFDR